MVHKKYIKKDGKLYGPYWYKNYREKGITKTQYLGKAPNDLRKKLQVNSKLFLSLFIGLVVLLLVLSLFFFFEKEKIATVGLSISQESVISSFSFDPSDNRSIGYEFLNSSGSVVPISEADTVHMWNIRDDYFFNLSSGIQFTNHFQDYWTRNLFCIGYYNGSTWNKIYCADELNNFNKNISTDNSTYVNATLWKDVSYGSYDLRLGINYYLELNDKNLSITVYGRNLGIDIPFDLGFAWRIRDIEIPYRTHNDTLFINNSYYNLDDGVDLLFTNMTKTYNITFYNQTTNETENITITEPIPFFILRDFNEFLRLDWNENLNYAVKINGTDQTDFYTALLVNAGHFNPDQEKSTTFYWIDAAGAVCVNETEFCFDTVQEGVDNATSGQTVIITDNDTYEENVNIDKNLYITSNASVGMPTIYGNDASPINMSESTDLTISNIKINASGSSNGIRAIKGVAAGLNINDTIIWINLTGTFTGAIYDTSTGGAASNILLDNVNITVVNATVGIRTDNTAATTNITINNTRIEGFASSEILNADTQFRQVTYENLFVNQTSSGDGLVVGRSIIKDSDIITTSGDAIIVEGADVNLTNLSIQTDTGRAVNIDNVRTRIISSNVTSNSSYPINLGSWATSTVSVTIIDSYVIGIRLYADGTSSAIRNVTAINASIDAGNLFFSSFDGADVANISIINYLDVNVTNSTVDPINGAVVNITNVNGTSIFNGTTNSTGSITRQNITYLDVYRIGAAQNNSYYSNHTINVSATGYVNQSREVNMTTNRQEDFTLNTNTSPQWSSNLINSTTIGTPVRHNLSWTDNSLSGYIFSFDNGTGTFVNDSFVSFTGGQNYSTVIKVINTTLGSTIRWIVYANDSFNQWNSTDTFNYNTTLSDWDVTAKTAFEFSTSGGDAMSLIGINDTHYLVAYRGPGLDGYAVVLEVNLTNWTITKPGDGTEFDSVNGIDHSLVKINDTHYLNAYGGPTSRGTAKVLQVNLTNWTIATQSSLQFDPNQGTHNSLVKINDTHYLNAYSGNVEDGYTSVFEVNLTNWTITEPGPLLEFDTARGYHNSLVKINDTHYLNVYAGADYDGYATVLQVNLTNWTITEPGSSLEFDTDNGQYNSLVKINDTHYLNVYAGADYDGYATVLQVNLTNWTITKPGPLLEFDTHNGTHNSLVKINNTHYLNVYSGIDDNAYAVVLEVNFTDWSINNTNGASLEFYTDTSTDHSLVKLNNTHYLDSYSGKDGDGYAIILEVNFLRGPPNLASVTLNATSIENRTLYNLTATNVSINTTGAILDYSTFENNGTLGNGTNITQPTWTSSGVSGGAYDFDGVDDFINSGTIDITSWNAMSAFAWFKFDAFASFPMILTIRYSGDDDIRIWRDSPGADLMVSFDDGSADEVETSFSDTTGWHHVGFNFDSSIWMVLRWGPQTLQFHLILQVQMV
jgi:hypothetical protein